MTRLTSAGVMSEVPEERSSLDSDPPPGAQDAILRVEISDIGTRFIIIYLGHSNFPQVSISLIRTRVALPVKEISDFNISG